MPEVRPSQSVSRVRLTPRIVGLSIALAFLAVHLATLPSTLEDLDSINFAMGVRDFDVARHQPHPPGYPVFIALSKVSTAALRTAAVPSPEVRGLAIWGAIGGAILLLAAHAMFLGLVRDEWQATAGVALLASSPLFWFTALRPLSDVAGLAVAIAAVSALVRALGWPGEAWTVERGRMLVWGAFVAGLAAGFRSQMAILTLPLLALTISLPGARVPGRVRVASAAAWSAAVLLWAVPLVTASGGAAAYLRALTGQAGEDFAGVEMLWTARSARVAVNALFHTAVLPWDSPVLAGIMLSLAAAGLALMTLRTSRAVLILALVFGPYAVFHILFQEAANLRYALPLVPAVAFCAAVVLKEARGTAGVVATGALALLGLEQAVPAGLAFARTSSPVFAALSEMRLLEAQGARPVVAMHRRVSTEARRAREWSGGPPGTLLPAPRDYEWLEATRVMRNESQAEVWFLADPRRTDLALIDDEHRQTRQYRWPFNARVYVGSARPDVLDWHIYRAPGWFLEHGWALTPETAGIADREGWGPHRRPSVGWVRRRSGETLMMIGGRHLGAATDPAVRVVVSIDDRAVVATDVQPGFFLCSTPLPAGTLVGPGDFASLTVAASVEGGGPSPPIAIEQFNLQDPQIVQFGYDEGWFEPEYNPRTARSWRWMGERAVLRVHHGGGDVVVRLRGESPMRYFRTPQNVRVVAGSQNLAEWRLDADFDLQVSVPAGVLDAAGGRLTLHAEQVYVATQREATADRRRLALRVFDVDVRR